MNAILMAAARGARIQELERWRGGCQWRSLSSVYLYQLTDNNINYRIHPDDEHLRFGPISTALREMAKTGKEPYTLVGLLAKVAVNHERDFPLIFADEWDQNVLFLLILSEALAEEGL